MGRSSPTEHAHPGWGLLLYALVLSSCGSCDEPTMPAAPAEPVQAELDAIDQRLKKMRQVHREAVEEATPEGSLLTHDTGTDGTSE